MNSPLIKEWTATHRENFGKNPIVWQHSMHESGLFTDEKLIELIEKHPRDLADFCTMDKNAEDMASWRGGDPGNHSGAELLKAVRSGHLWINLRKTFNIYPEYATLLQTVTDEMKAATPNFSAVSMMGGLLISSPSAGVPYHIDRSDVMLWHIRGRKRVWIYPMDDQTLPESEVEEILLHEHNDDVPYDKSFDDKAVVYDLEPGQAASWPLHSPHRVLNLGEMCVSLTVEYSPFSAVMQNGAQITNGILRRRLGLNPQIEKQGRLSRFIRFAVSRVLRKMTLVKAKTAHESGYLFSVDPEAATAVRELKQQKHAA